MDLRVRGILLTDHDTVVVIRRDKPGVPPYRALPGGGVEPGDTDPEAALVREVHEELAGTVKVGLCVHVVERTLPDGTPQQERFHLADLLDWSPTGGRGAEFTDPSRGGYTIEELPATAEALAHANLKPDHVARLLADHAEDLRALPAVR